MPLKLASWVENVAMSEDFEISSFVYAHVAKKAKTRSFCLKALWALFTTTLVE